MAILPSSGREARLTKFSQFCTCTPSEYANLKLQVDLCAQKGHSYEFAQCCLPPGCSPELAQVGFWRAGEDYLLYFRPAVIYSGPDLQLRDFFLRGAVQRFSGFPALTACLRTLSENARPAASIPTFRQLHQELQTRILGQDQAVEAASFKLWSHICKRAPLRPLSLIFYGPTGVGKSELGKAVVPALNRCLGEDRYHSVWTELNTFTQPHSVHRLTGAPPGYVGYDDPPVLEAVRRSPYTVFMFDELDKAHPDVLKVFMSILDEGRCIARREDSQGNRELDFRRCVFLFTTNADLSPTRTRGLGFFSPPDDCVCTDTQPQLPLPASANLAQRLFQADESARQALARSGVLREIAGRFSGLIGFQSLSPQARADVTVRQIAALGREYGLNIAQVSPAIVQALTPADALSLRSSVPMLEGMLTPLLSRFSAAGQGTVFRLEGTPENMRLLPA